MGWVLKAWFSLTARERWALLVVLSLFLAGVAARAWHLSRADQPPRNPAPVTRSAAP